MRSISEVRIAGRDAGKAADLAREVGGTAVGSFQEAIRGADIVCATTHSPEPVVRREWLSAGTHVTSVGVNPDGRELDEAFVADASVFVESRAAALASFPAGSNDLAGLSPAGAEREARRVFVEHDVEVPFDLVEGPLFRPVTKGGAEEASRMKRRSGVWSCAIPRGT